MAKRLMILLGMLALALTTAVPALAESEPRLTGVIEKPEATTYMYGTHAITDELGNLYALESDIVDLDDYVGQRVTVSGAFVAGYEDGQVEGGPPLFEVTHVESTGPPRATGSRRPSSWPRSASPPRVRRSTASSGSNRRSSPNPTIPTRASLRSWRTSAPSRSRWRS